MSLSSWQWTHNEKYHSNGVCSTSCPLSTFLNSWTLSMSLLQALSCPGLCTSPKQSKLELQLVKHPFWHRKATKKAGKWESGTMLLCAPLIFGLPPPAPCPLAGQEQQDVHPASGAMGRWGFSEQQARWKQQSSDCSFPFTDAIFRFVFSLSSPQLSQNPPEIFILISYFLILPPHH